jgi:hypothetical protein
MRTITFVWLLFASSLSIATTDWLNDDWEDRVEQLSEGELIWYRHAPAEGTSRMVLEVRFKPDSHQQGWLEVRQCHENLASVAAAQLVFEGRPVRALRIEKTENIQQAVIDNNTVQLTGVGKAARICVSSEQRILHRLDEHHWAIVSGPFQRRFLDGYYPMQVKMDIFWTADRWRLMRSRPARGPQINSTEDHLHMHAHFAGRLKMAFVFQHALMDR